MPDLSNQLVTSAVNSNKPLYSCDTERCIFCKLCFVLLCVEMNVTIRVENPLYRVLWGEWVVWVWEARMTAVRHVFEQCSVWWKIRLFFCHESHHSYVMCNKAEEIKITEAKLKWLALVFLHWVVLYVNECFFIQFPKILWVLDFFSMNIIWTILTACLYLYVRTWLCEPIVFCTQILREWSPYDNSFPVFFVKLSFLEWCLPNTLTKKSIHMPFLSNN